MAIKTLKELRNFEKQQEEKLELRKVGSLKETENAKKGIDRKIKDEKEELEKKKEEEIGNAKEKAKEEAKEIVEEYKKKIEQLEKKSSKNLEKAVDKVFSTILGKNV